MLNFLSLDSVEAKRQIVDVNEAGRSVRTGTNLVLVTHNFNIRPFAGALVSTTDVVVTQPTPDGHLELVGILSGLGKP
jgi:hypothetical protein